VKDEWLLPDATLVMGRADFGVWTTGWGVGKLSLPEVETVANGRSKSTVNVNINRRLGPKEYKSIEETASFLESMFGGSPPAVYPDVDIDGISEFSRIVLELTMKIPWGETRNYGWIAVKMGKPNAARAVGRALSRNPVPLVIPCHRVINGNGSLGGFGRGTEWKKRLLSIERA
jgi:O-6-methylguanine DNA methyltransferase